MRRLGWLFFTLLASCTWKEPAPPICRDRTAVEFSTALSDPGEYVLDVDSDTLDFTCTFVLGGTTNACMNADPTTFELHFVHETGRATSPYARLDGFLLETASRRLAIDLRSKAGVVYFDGVIRPEPAQTPCVDDERPPYFESTTTIRIGTEAAGGAASN